MIIKFLVFAVFAAGTFSGCTYNISMAHTEGVADDVIDDTQTPTSTASPQVELPLIGK